MIASVHIQALNAIWTLFLSLAIAETIIYFNGIVNLKNGGLRYRELYRLPHDQNLPDNEKDKALGWLDLTILTLLLWSLGYLAAIVPITQAAASHRPIDIFIASKVLAIAAANFVNRFILQQARKTWRSFLVPTLIGLGADLLREYFNQEYSLEKMYYILLWLIVFAVFMRYVTRYRHMPSDEESDPGPTKDFALLTVIFILGIILYPNIDNIVASSSGVLLVVGISIIAVITLVAELRYPRIRDGEHYCKLILARNKIPENQKNIMHLRAVMNAHINRRTLIFLVCGVVGPFVYYVLDHTFGKR